MWATPGGRCRAGGDGWFFSVSGVSGRYSENRHLLQPGKGLAGGTGGAGRTLWNYAGNSGKKMDRDASTQQAEGETEIGKPFLPGTDGMNFSVTLPTILERPRTTFPKGEVGFPGNPTAAITRRMCYGSEKKKKMYKRRGSDMFRGRGSCWKKVGMQDGDAWACP